MTVASDAALEPETVEPAAIAELVRADREDTAALERSASRALTPATFGPAAAYVARVEQAILRNPVAALAIAFAVGYVRGRLRLRRR